MTQWMWVRANYPVSLRGTRSVNPESPYNLCIPGSRCARPGMTAAVYSAPFASRFITSSS